MIDTTKIIKCEVPTYAELVNRRDITDKSLVLVKDSLDDPHNTKKIPKGLYTFCFDCQEWCRVCDVEETTLDEQYDAILKEYFKPGNEPKLISALLHFKDEIYKQVPGNAIDYKEWIEKITEPWLVHAADLAKKQKEDPMDLNTSFRVQICLIFCMILKSASNSEEFSQGLFFHLACQLTK